MVQKWCSVLLTVLFIITVSSLAGNAEGADYVGVKKCKACHIKQYKSWKETTMANSFENLKAGIKSDAKKKAGLDPDKDYTADAGCLKCHTTGYKKPGGFTTIEETPDLAGVQCEACHGAGADFRTIMKNKEFPLSEATAAGLVVPTVENNNCMDCHGSDSPFNEKVDAKYKFDIVERLKNTHEHFPLKYKH